MPKGIYKHKSLSKEHRKNISIGLKGHVISLETKKKISIANSISLKGRSRSEESKKKQGDTLRGRKRKPFSEEWKKNISLSKKGKKCLPFSNKHKENIGKASKGRKHSLEARRKNSISNTGRKMSSLAKEKISRWQIENPNRKFKNTKIELKIETELQKQKIVYKKQVPLSKIAIVDFYLSDFKIVIQCDGCYYHNCLIHYPKYHLEARNKDYKQDIILKSNGYKVYRFWEHEINKSPEECINRIKIDTKTTINPNLKK